MDLIPDFIARKHGKPFEYPDPRVKSVLVETYGIMVYQEQVMQAAQILVDRGVKALVVACNTASAVALEVLQQQHAPLPVFGVVEPGARAELGAWGTW